MLLSRPRTKLAAPLDVGTSPIQARQSDTAKADALRLAGRLGLVGLGVGGVAAGLTGLRKWLAPPPPRDRMALSVEDVTLPAGAVPDEDDETLAKRRRKRADWADSTVAATIPTPTNVPRPSILTPAWLRGDTQTDAAAVPWGIPAALGAGVGGLAAGGALVKWLIDKRLKKDKDNELDEAEREYERSLEGLHKGAGLDDCWPAVEKVAMIPLPKADSVLGAGTGTYLTLAALLAGLSGYGAYHLTRKGDPAKGMREALDERTRLRAMSSPPPIRLGLPPHDDEDELAPVRR